MPVERVIKNSWGLNANTSSDPRLLKRFPFPAYTIMTQMFYETSHRLQEGRYEAIVPRNVCLRNDKRAWVCEALIKDDAPKGFPADGKADLTLNDKLILENMNQPKRRYPVQYLSGANQIAESDPLMKLVPSPLSQTTTLLQFNLDRDTKIMDMIDESFLFCTKIEADPKVKYAAVYFTDNVSDPPHSSPNFVLSSQSGWQYCNPHPGAEKSFRVFLQAVNEKYKVIGEIEAKVEIHAGS